MNTLIILAAVIACVAANPHRVEISQDTSGNYELFYNYDDVVRSEKGSADGTRLGHFEYVDKYGVMHKIKFTVGPDGGYHAEGADVPTPVFDTPAVLAVRAAHLAVDQKQRTYLPPLLEEHVQEPEFTFVRSALPVHHSRPVAVPVYVDNTAEIEAAKVEHFAAHKAALARLAEAYRKLEH